MDKGPPTWGGVHNKWSPVMVAFTSERTHTLKNFLNVVGVWIAVFNPQLSFPFSANP